MGVRVLLKKDSLPAHLRAIEEISGRKRPAGFDFPATKVGQSTWLGTDSRPVTVYYDPAAGIHYMLRKEYDALEITRDRPSWEDYYARRLTQVTTEWKATASGIGLADAQFALAFIDQLMTYNDTVFGVRGQGGNVIVAAVPGGGAYHYGCSFDSGGDWYEAADPDTRLTFGLVQAEVVESYMGLAGKGWNCGGSGGEALSRVLAEIVSGGPINGSLSGFASGPSYNGADWISRDQGTDGDYPSIGCGVLYLWWMLGTHTIQQIVQAGEPDGTLASNYAALTGKPKSQAFGDFKAALAAAGGPTSDNPFGTPTPQWQNVPPTPPPPVTVAVPNVVGQSWPAAQTTIGTLDLLPVAVGDVSSPNVVASESPAAGTQAPLGSTVTCTMSSAPVPPPPPPPPTVFPVYDIVLNFAGINITGTATPTPAGIDELANWQLILADLVALRAARKSGDPAAVAKARAKLLADLGL